MCLFRGLSAERRPKLTTARIQVQGFSLQCRRSTMQTRGSFYPRAQSALARSLFILALNLPAQYEIGEARPTLSTVSGLYPFPVYSSL